MTARVCPRLPWERACFKLDASQQLPDSVDLSDEPQLASVAVLQAAAKVAAHALDAHYGVGRRLQDELCEDPDCIIAVLAHLIADRCNELSELIATYRLALQRPRSDDQSDLPF
jgi:hypothetical protein